MRNFSVGKLFLRSNIFIIVPSLYFKALNVFTFISHFHQITLINLLKSTVTSRRHCHGVWFFFLTFKSFFVTQSKCNTCKSSQSIFGKNYPSWENYKKYFQLHAVPSTFSSKTIIWTNMSDNTAWMILFCIFLLHCGNK